jgi:hypothetical protein
MTDQIEQLKTAQRMLDELRKIKEHKTYAGCGLYLTVCCGREDAFPIDLVFGCSTDVSRLVDTLIEHQQDIVIFWRKALVDAMSKAKILLAD